MTATLTPASLPTDSASPFTLLVTGLPNSGAVTVERIVDANGNATVDAGEFLAEILTVTDGQWPSIGGVRNTGVLGDGDSLVNGQISLALKVGEGPELGRLAGAQIVRISSPTAAFASFTRTLTLTQPAAGQSIHGTVLNGASPVANASVILTDVNKDGEYTTGVVADAAGAFSINAPPGAYELSALKGGIVAPFGAGGTITLGSGASVARNISAVPATTTISGKVADSATGAGLGGVQLFLGSTAGQVVIASTRADGTYTAQVTAGNWSVNLSEISLVRLGYVRPPRSGEEDLAVSTIAGAATGADLPVPRVTALIHGAVKNPAGLPIPGILISANTGSANGSYVETRTDAAGGYLLGVLPGAWYVNVNNDDPAAAGYVLPNGSDVTPGTGQAVRVEFVLSAVNAHLAGVVTKDGVPLSGLKVRARNDAAGQDVQTTSGAGGVFDLGVTAGTWSLEADSDSASTFHVIGARLEYTVAANQTVSGIPFRVRSTTASIAGLVKNAQGTPEAGLGVHAEATIDGMDYNEFILTDATGHYAFGVINGTWRVSLSGDDLASRGYGPVADRTVVVSGSDKTEDFTLAVPNAHLTGTVTKNGTPLSGLRMGAYNQTANLYVSATTGAGGTFDLGLTSGTWSLQAETESAASFNVVGPGLDYTLAVNQTISGIVYQVLPLTSTISGVVENSLGAPLAALSVYLDSTINGFHYFSSAVTDVSGHYSAGVANGTWNVGPSWDELAARGYGQPQNKEAVVSGAGVVVNFVVLPPDVTAPSLVSSQPSNGATGVALDRAVEFTFSEPMQQGFSIDWSPNVDAGQFSMAWSGDGLTLTCTYPADFPAGATISWVLNPAGMQAGFMDLAGNPLPAAVSGSFTTGSAPVLVWTRKPFMPTARNGARAAVMNGLLYVVGGFGTTGAGNALEVYDPLLGTWRSLAPMPTARHSAAVGTIDGRLYVAGGTSGGAVLEVYDPVTNTWSARHPMNIAHGSAGGGVIDGKFYVAGPSTDFTKSLEVYDPAADTWTVRTPMPNPRTAAVAVLHGLLYTVAGDAARTLEVYDPATDTWTGKASAPGTGTIFGHGAAVLGGRIYLVGGYNHGTKLEVYNPATDQWTQGPDVFFARADLAVASAGDKLFAIGGVEAPGAVPLPVFEQLGLATGDRVVTTTLVSDGMTGAAALGTGVPSAATLAKLNAGDTTSLTFSSALVGTFGTTSIELPTGSPAGTQVISIPSGNGQNGFFKMTFDLPSNFASAQLSCGATMDYYGRAFLNGNALTPAIDSAQPAPAAGTIRSELGQDVFFSTRTAGFFHAGTNTVLLADINANGGASAGAFFGLVTYVVDPMAGWRQTHFGTTANSGASGDLADPDKDGIPNILEYAFGLSPTQNTSAQLPRPQANGTSLGLSFSQPAGVTGIIYGAEWSATLQDGDWHPLPDTGTGSQHIFTAPAGVLEARFIRLRATSQ